MFAAMLGGWEIVLILAVVLILFGAKKLPDLAKGLGQGIKEFKKATREVTDEINSAVNDDRSYSPPSNRVDYSPPKKLPEDSAPETATPVAQSVEHKS
jgi:sec-independent protein translocase protein TatA